MTCRLSINPILMMNAANGRSESAEKKSKKAKNFSQSKDVFEDRGRRQSKLSQRK